MIGGTVYGVVLNDRDERPRLSDAFAAPPYQSPPIAPVLYIKTRNTFVLACNKVAIPESVPEVEVAATLGLLFNRDTTAVRRDDAIERVGAVCLALDISVPQDNYYRPATCYRNRDGFLPLGAFTTVPGNFASCEIVTLIDGEEKHRWRLSRLLRSVDQMIVDISAFMTLKAGDLLLVGLPGDAPRAARGARIELASAGLPSLRTTIIAEPDE